MVVSPSAPTDVKVENIEGRHCRLRETTFQLLTIIGTLPFIKAFVGVSQRVEVPKEYEFESDFPSGQQPEANRMFGAYAVVNVNDSDSDGTPDNQDNFVKSQDNNNHLHEVDLIKLVVTIPGTFNFAKNCNSCPKYEIKGQNTNVKLWQDKYKTAEWTGFSSCVIGHTEDVWVEMTETSSAIASSSIRFYHQYQPVPGGDYSVGYDEVSLTGIFCEYKGTGRDYVPRIITNLTKNDQFGMSFTIDYP